MSTLAPRLSMPPGGIAVPKLHRIPPGAFGLSEATSSRSSTHQDEVGADTERLLDAIGVAPPLDASPWFLGSWYVIVFDRLGRIPYAVGGVERLEFLPNGHGVLITGPLEAHLDCRFDKVRVEYSWTGTDGGKPEVGRGWAELRDYSEMVGRLLVHGGSEIEFVAERTSPGP